MSSHGSWPPLAWCPRPKPAHPGQRLDTPNPRPPALPVPCTQVLSHAFKGGAARCFEAAWRDYPCWHAQLQAKGGKGLGKGKGKGEERGMGE